MKLGVLPTALPDLTLDPVAEWAAGEGFESLEVACWPGGGGERRRYAGVTQLGVEVVGTFVGSDRDRWVSIEHEDRRFEGDEELVKRGFPLALNTFRPLIV